MLTVSRTRAEKTLGVGTGKFTYFFFHCAFIASEVVLVLIYYFSTTCLLGILGCPASLFNAIQTAWLVYAS